MQANFALNLSILACLICWGAWGIFDKLALAKAPAFVVAACLAACAMPAALITFIFLQSSGAGWHPTPEIFFWVTLGFFSYGIATLCYLQAMAMGEASYVLGATASYPIVLQFLSFLVLAEPIVPVRLAGSVLVALGVAAIGFSNNQHGDRPWKNPRLLLLVIAATLLWGIWGVFDKKAVTLAGPTPCFLAHCLIESSASIALLIFAFLKYRASFAKGQLPLLPIGASALCLKFGGFCYLFAMSMATASYVIVITGCYPMIMYLLALWILKERFNRVRLLGIVLVTAGGIITQTTQGG